MYGWPYRLFSCRCDGGDATLPDASLPTLYDGFLARLVEALIEHGHLDEDHPPEWSPAVSDALREAQEMAGFRTDRTVPGPEIIQRLENKPTERPRPGRDPDWMVEARKYIGAREIKGATDNPTVVGFWAEIGANWFNDDETPWCGGFVGAVLKRAGYPTLSAAQAPRARAWLNYGHAISEPVVGAVVVFWRGSRNGTSGHVGFVAGADRFGRLMVLGGNQSDAVTIAAFDRDRVLGFRWPPDTPKPDGGWKTLPTLSGPVSTSEA